MSPIRTTPPTTPPAIAPTGVLEWLVLLELGFEFADEGLPESEMVWGVKLRSTISLLVRHSKTNMRLTSTPEAKMPLRRRV